MARRGPYRRRSTPAGEHRPVLIDAVLRVLDPKPGQVFVDGTVGFGGHSAALLQAVGPTGHVIGFDLDRENLERARARLTEVGNPFTLVHGNFAGFAQGIAEAGFHQVHGVLADLGFSSMQVDDPARGFSYRREGPLDMRLDQSRGKTAAQILERIEEDELARHLRELGDEPRAETIAAAIVQQRRVAPLETTSQLSELIQSATRQTDWRLRPQSGVWTLHPAARTFQALRILVNRELANLEHLLRTIPDWLSPGAKAAIISFHSGEDRLVKSAFRDGQFRGVYDEIADDPIRADFHERTDNPRSRSAKLRWAQRCADE